jgi:hypothetical protein
MEQAASLTMLEKTMDLLGNCGLSLTEISNMSGLGYEWLKKLKAGDIPDPGINRIERLHNFLTHRLRLESVRYPLV